MNKAVLIAGVGILALGLSKSSDKLIDKVTSIAKTPNFVPFVIIMLILFTLTSTTNGSVKTAGNAFIVLVIITYLLKNRGIPE